MRTDTQAGQTTRDIFELLRRDHQQVRGLLDEMEGTEERDAVRRQELFEHLVTALEAHSQAEEDVFYSVLEQHEELADRIDEARQEHDDIDQLLEELDEVSVSDAGWMDKIHELRQIIQRHVDEEEGEVFALARRHLSAEEVTRLAREFSRARETIQADVTGEATLGELERAQGQGAADMSEPGQPGTSDLGGGAGMAEDRLVVGEGTDDEAMDEPAAEAGEEEPTRAEGQGGAERDDIEQMSKKELYELARQRQIEGRSAMTKAELVQAIRAAK